MREETPLIPAVLKAAKLLGGVKALAKKLKISRQALYNWRRIPAERAKQIEKFTKGAVTLHELRPDLW